MKPIKKIRASKFLCAALLTLVVAACTAAFATFAEDDIFEDARGVQFKYTLETDNTTNQTTATITGAVTETLDSKPTLTIPGTISDETNTYPVGRIGYEAFATKEEYIFNNEEGVSPLETVKKLPDSVKSVVFPKDSAIEVGYAAFSGCTSLTEIDLKNVTSLGDYAFQNCTSLTSVDLGNVTSLGSYVFTGCASLTSVDLGNVTSLEDYAFSGCTSLTEIDLKNVTSLGDGAFSGCTSLTEIDLENVTSLGNTAFSDCTSLRTIDLGRHVKGIVEYVFTGTIATSLEIPASVETISPNAFAGMSNLKNLSVAEDSTHFAMDGDILYTKGDNKELILVAPYAELGEALVIPSDVKKVNLESMALLLLQYDTKLFIPKDCAVVGDISATAPYGIFEYELAANGKSVTITNAYGKKITGLYEDAMGDDYVITKTPEGIALWTWEETTGKADDSHLGGTLKYCEETKGSKFIANEEGGYLVGTSPDKYPGDKFIGDLAKRFRTINDLSDKQLEVIIEDPLGLYDGVMINVNTIDTGISTNYDDVNSVERSYNVNLEFYKLEKMNFLKDALQGGFFMKAAFDKMSDKKSVIEAYMEVLNEEDGRGILEAMDSNGFIIVNYGNHMVAYKLYPNEDGGLDSDYDVYLATKLSELDGYVRLLLELPEGWDDDEVQAVRINEEADTDYAERIEYRLYDAEGNFLHVVDKDYTPKSGESVRKFIAIWTNHFSNYGLVDPDANAATGGTTENLVNTTTGSQSGLTGTAAAGNGNVTATKATGKGKSGAALKTGENSEKLAFIVFVSAAMVLAMYLLLQKRRKFTV